MVRAPFYDQKGLKKGAWSPEEDEKLRNYAHKYGCCNWRQLPQLAGLKRCGKSCRLRWMNYLKPDLRHGSFSQKEDELILQLHQQLGNRWSLIAAALPGRTDNEIKNHWHTHLRKLNQTSSSGSRKDPEPNPAQTLLLSRSESAGSCTYLSADDLPHPILESSPLSPEISYSSAGASSSTSTDGSDPGPVASEHDLGPSEILVRNGTGCGDFWTEPFVVENASSNRPDLLLYHEEPVDDLFYQVMQEFPDM